MLQTAPLPLERLSTNRQPLARKLLHEQLGPFLVSDEQEREAGVVRFQGALLSVQAIHVGQLNNRANHIADLVDRIVVQQNLVGRQLARLSLDAGSNSGPAAGLIGLKHRLGSIRFAHDDAPRCVLRMRCKSGDTLAAARVRLKHTRPVSGMAGAFRTLCPTLEPVSRFLQQSLRQFSNRPTMGRRRSLRFRQNWTRRAALLCQA